MKLHTKQRQNNGNTTSVVVTNEQVEFFESNQGLTKKAAWDLGCFLLMAALEGAGSATFELDGEKFTISIKGELCQHDN